MLSEALFVSKWYPSLHYEHIISYASKVYSLQFKGSTTVPSGCQLYKTHFKVPSS